MQQAGTGIGFVLVRNMGQLVTVQCGGVQAVCRQQDVTGKLVITDIAGMCGGNDLACQGIFFHRRNTGPRCSGMPVQCLHALRIQQDEQEEEGQQPA